MRIGDLVQSLQGAWRRVVSITPVEGQETVYNFTVAKDHDYFVGETGFLVHNSRCRCSFTPRGGPTFYGVSGDPARLLPLNPTLARLAEERLGPIGAQALGRTIGGCAEFDAANQALNAGYELEGGIFGPATFRGLPKPPCPICQKIFSGLLP